MCKYPNRCGVRELSNIGYAFGIGVIEAFKVNGVYAGIAHADTDTDDINALLFTCDGNSMLRVDGNDVNLYAALAMLEDCGSDDEVQALRELRGIIADIVDDINDDHDTAIDIATLSLYNVATAHLSLC